MDINLLEYQSTITSSGNDAYRFLDSTYIVQDIYISPNKDFDMNIQTKMT